jgi:hypothetical protein
LDLEREQAKPVEAGREWHYSRVQRWQDREKQQRRRRIEWMQKLCATCTSRSENM